MNCTHENCEAPGGYALTKPMHSSHWCLTRSSYPVNILCETHGRELLKKWNSR